MHLLTFKLQATNTSYKQRASFRISCQEACEIADGSTTQIEAPLTKEKIRNGEKDLKNEMLKMK